MKDNFQDSVEDNLNALVAVGTLMNQLGRLDPDDLLQKDAVETVRTALNKLFKDYIEAHMPNGMSEDEFSITYTLANDPPEDMADDFTPKQALNMAKSYNQALQQYKSNLLEGLSDG